MKKLLVIFFFFALAASSFAQQSFPQLDINGFKKWEYKKADASPPRNYFTALSQLGGYYPTFTGGPWQERLQLQITGQLSENLAVSYDLDQQPETPERYDVKVKYYNNELTFGDISANFTGNEFVSGSKALNGVMLSAKESWYDVLVVPSAKLKSQTMTLTSQLGNNTSGPYNLGHGSIVEGSEQIQLNNVPLRKGVDYTIDYFEGKITFNHMLNQTDEFKYSYEFTNILDMFFPTLSKKDFVGFQSRFTIDPEKFGVEPPKPEPLMAETTEYFPSKGSIEADVQEEEASGRYRIKNTPIIKFSEILTFMGTRLKKNEDYSIRYDTGELMLLTRFLPSSEEALKVEFKYNLVSTEVESIPGIGSRGPYTVKKFPLVADSESIKLDSRQLVRNLDYTIDYNTGVIMFNSNVGPTSQINITFSYNVMVVPVAAQSKYPKELKLGLTYLKESAKRGGGSPTATAVESFTGQKIINSKFLINLTNRPVVPTTEAVLSVALRQGGTVRLLTWESEYVIPSVEVDPVTGFVTHRPDVSLAYLNDKTDATDGLRTGTIYLVKQDIGASDEVSVTYTYTKSIVGKYSGAGNGSLGPYYLRSTRDIVPGSETLQVWDQGSSTITTYTRNSSFEGNAGDNGYFINYNSTNPYISFNVPLAATKNFQLIYQYIPPTTTNNDNITQSALGVDGVFKFGNIFKIDSSFARSENDQVIVSASSVESFSGNGTKIYSLHSAGDLIDGSEQIFVNQKLLNKDIDYFVSYTKPGQFNFYYITPATQDVISVNYNYQSSSGGAVAQALKIDNAYRFGAETKLFGDKLTLNGTAKGIGFDFSPLGGTAIGVGSEYEEYNLMFNPGVHALSANYSYKLSKNPIGNTRTTFLRTYDNSFSGSVNPGGNVKIDLVYRQLNSIDDLLPGSALHNNDAQQETYTASITPANISKGALSLTQKYDISRTVSKNDTIDKAANLSRTAINYYHAGGNLAFTNRFSCGADFQYNEPLTTGSGEAITAHTVSTDNSANLNLDLTMGFLQKWATRVSLLNHNDYSLAPAALTSNSTKNETYHMDLNPFAILTSALDHERQERTTFVAGGENPKSQRTTGSVRLAPISWFSAGINASKGDNVPDSGAINRTTNRSLGYNIDYTPISFKVFSLVTQFVVTDAYQTGPLGVEMVRTDTKTLSQNYTMNINPIPVLPIMLGINQEDYRNYNNSAASQVNTNTQNQTTTADIKLMLPSLPQLSAGANIVNKITKDLIAGNSRPKSNLSGKVGYQVQSWGTLSYGIDKEINKGEVQAGTVVDLDYEKTTQSISFNALFPINNPVLNNFTLVASLKTVNYVNNKSNVDNFDASLLSFEGTMNF